MLDFNLDTGSPVNNDETSLIFQQIDILFDTVPKEVLGDEEFGTRYDELLYKLNLSNTAIQQQVLSDLRSLDLFGYDPTVEVFLLQGSEQDIALIDITLTRDNESYRRIYKIT